MKKALKTLDNPNESLTQEEQITHTRRCLVQIGDHIERCLETIKDPDAVREWKRYVLHYFIFILRIVQVLKPSQGSLPVCPGVQERDSK